MTYEAGDILFHPFDIITVEAEVDVSKGQLVDFTSAWKVSPTNGVQDIAIGVALNDAKAGENVEILLFCPIVILIADGPIAVGDYVGPTTTAGRIVAVDRADQPVDEGGTATYTFSFRPIIGIAIESGVAGDKIAVALCHMIISLTPY